MGRLSLQRQCHPRRLRRQRGGDRRRRDASLLEPPHGGERGGAAGSCHSRVDGELLAGRRLRRRRGDVIDPGLVGHLEDKPNNVVSTKRNTFPWTNGHHIAGDLRTGMQRLKDATPTGGLPGSGKLAAELDRLDLFDECDSFTRWSSTVPPGLPAAGGVERAVAQFLDLATHPLLDSGTGDQALAI